jgi:hypothetical protein
MRFSTSSLSKDDFLATALRRINLAVLAVFLMRYRTIFSFNPHLCILKLPRRKAYQSKVSLSLHSQLQVFEI